MAVKALAVAWRVRGRVFVSGASIPAAVALVALGGEGLVMFALAAGILVPLVLLSQDATAALISRSGARIGSLLNVTFGNSAQLAIALLALGQGAHEIVKASVVGSVVSNVLLGVGLSVVVGGARRERQMFDRTAAGSYALMLFLAATVLLFPALFTLTEDDSLPLPSATLREYPDDVVAMSVVLAVLLLAMYVAGLVFFTGTHRELFGPVDEEDSDHFDTAWSLPSAITLLAVSSVLVVLIGDLLVGSIHDAAITLGSSDFFLAFVVVGAVGSITTNTFADAARDRMDAVIHITIGGSVQSAMVVVPLLVIASLAIGPIPMALVFNAYEVSAVLIAVLIAMFLAQVGHTTWFVGLQLVSAWTVLGIVAYYA